MGAFGNIVIKSIDEAVTIHGYTGRRVNIENRECYGLSFCQSGKITYTHGDKKFVSEQGTAVILPQGATYSLYENAGGDFPLIDFTCTAPFTDEFIVIPLGYDGDYLSDFERLKELYITGRGRLKMLGILYGIFDRLSGEGHIPSVLTSAFNYISENISDAALKNREIAESIGVSECYLRRLFSENYGKSPRKYILEQRINLACDILCSQSVSVGGIADKCGFSSVYHFCRAFKERTGLTPTEYRKAYRNKGI